VYADQYDDLSLDFTKRPNQSVSSEMNKFEISHDLVGKALLNSWIFPQALVDAVGFHHNPLKFSGDSPFPMVVFLADLLSHGLDSEEYDQPELSKLYFNQNVCQKAGEIGLNWSSKHCLVYAEEYQELLDRESELFDMLISG